MQPWLVWLSWLEHHRIYGKVLGSIPIQDTYLGYAFNPRLGRRWKAINVLSHLISLSLFLLSSLSKNQWAYPQAKIKKKKNIKNAVFRKKLVRNIMS